jgi:hypothetical protein
MKMLRKAFERLSYFRPDQDVEPVVMLNKLLDNVDKLESCVIVRAWKDGTVDVAWTSMKKERLVYMTDVLVQTKNIICRMQ